MRSGFLFKRGPCSLKRDFRQRSLVRSIQPDAAAEGTKMLGISSMHIHAIYVCTMGSNRHEKLSFMIARRRVALFCLNNVARGSSAAPRLGLVVQVVIPAGPSFVKGKLRPWAPLQKGHNFNARQRSCVWFSHLSTREKNVASDVLQIVDRVGA